MTVSAGRQVVQSVVSSWPSRRLDSNETVDGDGEGGGHVVVVDVDSPPPLPGPGAPQGCPLPQNLTVC